MNVAIKDKKKIALVLSGGGIKAAAFHIGVCLALRQKGFTFVGGNKEEVKENYPQINPRQIRLYVGSSAGAYVASVLAAGYNLETLVNSFKVSLGQRPSYKESSTTKKLKPLTYRNIFSLNGRAILFSFPTNLFKKRLFNPEGGIESLIKENFKLSGFFTTKKMEKFLREKVFTQNEFSQLGVELFLVGTQLDHTRKVLFGPFKETSKTDNVYFVNYAKISEGVAASTSLPPVFSPYGIKAPDGKTIYFIDGEVRDTLSTHVAEDHGADLVISSYSVQPYHYNDQIGSLNQYGMPVILNQALYQVIQQKIDRHIRHQEEIKSAYRLIEAYLNQNNIPAEHREKILQILQSKVKFKPNTDSIFIHPPPQNHEMFFADHFSLNPRMLEKIVKIGYRSAYLRLKEAGL